MMRANLLFHIQDNVKTNNLHLSKGTLAQTLRYTKTVQLKKWKVIDQQYDHNIIKFELHSNQHSIAIYKPKTVNKLFKKWFIANADYTNYSKHIGDLINVKRKTISKTSNIHYIYNIMTKSIITASKHFKRTFYVQFDINARVASIKEIRDIAKQLNNPDTDPDTYKTIRNKYDELYNMYHDEILTKRLEELSTDENSFFKFKTGLNKPKINASNQILHNKQDKQFHTDKEIANGFRILCKTNTYNALKPIYYNKNSAPKVTMQEVTSSIQLLKTKKSCWTRRNYSRVYQKYTTQCN